MTSKDVLTILINAALDNPYSKRTLNNHYSMLINIINKDLEVLEILKNKKVDIDYFEDTIDHYENDNDNDKSLERYNRVNGIELTQEEFNKIKEWLKNGEK